MRVLSSIELPHWLMIAGAILIAMGFLGLAFTRYKEVATTRDSGSRRDLDYLLSRRALNGGRARSFWPLAQGSGPWEDACAPPPRGLWRDPSAKPRPLAASLFDFIARSWGMSARPQKITFERAGSSKRLGKVWTSKRAWIVVPECPDRKRL
jgi:hypothetical protein